MKVLPRCACGLTLCTMLLSFQLAFAEPLVVRIVPTISDNSVLPDAIQPEYPGFNSLRIVAAPDQFEPASFVIYANEPLDDLQVIATELRDAQGTPLERATIDIRVVKRWYQRAFGAGTDTFDPRMRFMVSELLLYDDDLVQVRGTDNYLRLQTGEYRNISTPGRKQGGSVTPRIDEFPVKDAAELQPLSISKSGNKQLWLTVYVPAGAAPGYYAAEIVLMSKGRQLALLPLTLEVLPFELSKPRIDYSFYYRGVLDEAWPAGSVSSEYKSEAQMLAELKNMKAHGVSNPTVYQSLSSDLLGRVLGLRKQAGMDTERLFYLGVDMGPAVKRSLQAGQAYQEPELPELVNKTKKIAADFDFENVYFYARDEARGEQLLEQQAVWNEIQEAGGRVMAAGWRSSGDKPGNFDMTGGQEDLYVCLGMLSRFEAARWHGKGKLIYSYQNPTGGQELPETWRRNYGLLLWQYDYDGALPYAWQHSFSDGWNDFDHAEYKDHNFTYPAVDSVIDTLQWEGFREGVDDLRYLSTLLDALESEPGKSSPYAPAARTWLRKLKDAPLGRMDLAAVREQMTGHILALKGFNPGSPNQSSRVSDARLGIAPGGASAVATVSGPLTIDSFSIEPVLGDGTAFAGWQTPVRATAQIRIYGLRAGVVTVKSDAMNLVHRLPVSGLKPNKKYRCQVTSVSLVGERATKSCLIDTKTVIGLEGQQVGSAGVGEIAPDLVSNYRLSAAIDWRESLLGWWRFSAGDGLREDSSGRGEQATLESGAISAAGWFGSGVRLNGSGAYVSAKAIAIPSNGPATIEGWFRFRSFAMDNKSLMGVFSGLYQHDVSNNFYFDGTNDYFEAASFLQTGVWHHLALTWEGATATAYLYVDGRQLSPVIQGAVEDIAAINGLRIGDHTNFVGKLMQRTNNTFDGNVDEIRVWNRVLSPEEVRASYDANSNRLRASFPAVAGAQADWSIIGANAADQTIAD